MIRQSKEVYQKLRNVLLNKSMRHIHGMEKDFEDQYKNTTRELEELEKLTTKLHSSDELGVSSIFIAYDEQYNIEHIDVEVPKLLGYMPGELMGTSISDMACCGDDMTNLLEEGDFPATDIKINTKEGKSIWVKLSGLLLHDAKSNPRKGIVFGILL